ncbi:MAG TPA: MATE family efflux transporter, partial [Saprospiraceae bacterium]|nr:MATE family efflux transporter [Saprospiraceae bacterium]
MRRIFRILKEALTGEEKNYTSGSIDRAIILLSIPMVLEMAGESIFAVVDAFFVSKIGPDAVATVGITETMLTLVYSLAIGVSAAATAMIARRVGEGDPQAASRAAAQTILLGTSISILLGIFGWIYAPEILRFMGGSEELIENGVGFTRIMFGTNIAIVLLFLLNAIFRGAGDASIAMQSLWIANAINIVLDPCLIFGLGPFPEMGIQGAAVATSIGRGAGVVFQLFILLNGRSILKIMRSYWRPRLDIIWRLIKVSAGGTGQFIIASASWIFLMRIVAKFGSEVVAGYTIAIRLLILTILPSWGMSNA